MAIINITGSVIYEDIMIKEKGFTLIEVLVTVVVLAVGLLGLAGIQVNALKHNQTAYFRSQATQLAYDMADRIRANRLEASKGAESNYHLIIPSDASAQGSCTIISGACSSTAMAENDLFEWNASLISIFPGNNVLGNVTFADPWFNIVIQWDDNRDGTIDSDDLSFQTDVQI